MAEVLVNPGVPKSRSFHQEIAVLRPRLISRPSASFAVEKQHSLAASGRSLPSNCLGSSTNSPSSSICLYSRSSSLKSLRTLSSSPDSSESGSSMNHPPRINVMPRYTSSPQSLHQLAMSSSTGFVDHATGFSNSNTGTICGDSEFIERIHEFQLYTPDPCMGSQINQMPLADMHWASKNMSFVTESEETPSPSSSFDTMDMPKDDTPTIWDATNSTICASSNARPTPSSTNAHGCRFQSFEIPSQEYTGYTPFPSNVWLPPGDMSPWMQQPYIADTMLDSYQYHEVFNPEWKVNHETQLQKTFPSSIRAMNYIQQPIPIPQQPFHTTTTPTAGSPQLDLKQMPAPINPPNTQPYQDLNQPFIYSEYQEANTSPPLPADTIPISTTQYIQSPPLPQPAYPQSQPQFTSTPLEAQLHLTDIQNAFLIESKQKGLSYKEIKRLGKFKEAESTLRGRFRTLTKRKDQRVRKPKWTDRDMTLLCEAVSVLSDKMSDPDKRDLPFARSQSCEQNIYQLGSYQLSLDAGPGLNQAPKVSWKKVGQYILNNGGSYQFGNATCKKKWCEVHGVKA